MNSGATPSTALPRVYPELPSARDRFVLSHRPARARPDPWVHQGTLVEDERLRDGSVIRSATIFLTGRECPWRCVMCDLWMHTIAGDTPPGALVAQTEAACRRLPDPRPVQVKLYNAGSFFDPRAVPESDYDGIARAVRGFARVVVESHPRLIGDRLTRWRQALARAGGAPPVLEVAMGLETANPIALERLHKRFSLDDFARAAARILEAGAELRVFLLVGVPFVPPQAQLEWIERSVTYAFRCGASVVSLIPTRGGNGALEEIERAQLFRPPTVRDLEAALETALSARAAHRRSGSSACGPSSGEPASVLADLWDLERFARCPSCLAARRGRLTMMNLTQRRLARVECAACAGEAA